MSRPAAVVQMAAFWFVEVWPVGVGRSCAAGEGGADRDGLGLAKVV